MFMHIKFNKWRSRITPTNSLEPISLLHLIQSTGLSALYRKTSKSSAQAWQSGQRGLKTGHAISCRPSSRLPGKLRTDGRGWVSQTKTIQSADTNDESSVGSSLQSFSTLYSRDLYTWKVCVRYLRFSNEFASEHLNSAILFLFAYHTQGRFRVRPRPQYRISVLHA